MIGEWRECLACRLTEQMVVRFTARPPPDSNLQAFEFPAIRQVTQRLRVRVRRENTASRAEVRNTGDDGEIGTAHVSTRWPVDPALDGWSLQLGVTLSASIPGLRIV
jgi:hypothetical protein